MRETRSERDETLELELLHSDIAHLEREVADETAMADRLAEALIAVGFVHPLAPAIQTHIDAWEQRRLAQRAKQQPE